LGGKEIGFLYATILIFSKNVQEKGIVEMYCTGENCNPDKLDAFY